eukprot:365337-Chlamydomonas_euryale.AAC.9
MPEHLSRHVVLHARARCALPSGRRHFASCKGHAEHRVGLRGGGASTAVFGRRPPDRGARAGGGRHAAARGGGAGVKRCGAARHVWMCGPVWSVWMGADQCGQCADVWPAWSCTVGVGQCGMCGPVCEVWTVRGVCGSVWPKVAVTGPRRTNDARCNGCDVKLVEVKLNVIHPYTYGRLMNLQYKWARGANNIQKCHGFQDSAKSPRFDSDSRSQCGPLVCFTGAPGVVDAALAGGRDCGPPPG